MNAITIKTVTTVDTGETIDGVTVLGDYHMNGGYDWMELIGEHGWAVIPSWGCDGWDLGHWPYVMVAGIRTADAIGNQFGMATYCEGDVSCTFYRTKARFWEAISEQAFFHWKNGQAQGPGRPARSRRRTAQPLPDSLHVPGSGLTLSRTALPGGQPPPGKAPPPPIHS